MAYYSSPKAYAAILQNLATRSPAEQQRGLDQLARLSVKSFQKVSKQLMSGRVSAERLAELGHPYSREHGFPLNRIGFNKRGRLRTRQTRSVISTLPINRQTSQLYESMDFYVVAHSNTRTVWLRNDQPYSWFQLDPFDQGTSRMVNRGFWKKMIEFHEFQMRRVTLRINSWGLPGGI